MTNAFLIGEKLYLRPLTKADAPVLVTFMNDSEVTRTLDRWQPMNVKAEEEWIDHLYPSEDQFTLGIVLKLTDRLIGATDLREIKLTDRKASFGIMIGAKDEWHKRHCTDATRLMVGMAFEKVNLNRIELHVYANNPHAIRAYERVGFTREGTLRQSVYREGRYVDVHVMAVLRQDWDRESRDHDSISTL